jgi:hypothetical protein
VRHEGRKSQGLLDWPEGYVESFAGAPEDFRRPAQGKVDEREKLA